MPKYVIERDFPGAGKLNQEQLQEVAQKSCDTMRSQGNEINWQHSYVAEDKIYCVYIAPNEKVIREHGKQGGFPVTRISMVSTIIDPVTAEVSMPVV